VKSGDERVELVESFEKLELIFEFLVGNCEFLVHGRVVFE
jgi:hypothetical protein